MNTELKTQPLPAEGLRCATRSGRACNPLKAWWVLANRRSGQGLAIMLAYMGNWTFQAAPRGGAVLVRLDTAPRGLQPFATIGGLPIPGRWSPSSAATGTTGPSPSCDTSAGGCCATWGPRGRRCSTTTGTTARGK